MTGKKPPDRGAGRAETKDWHGMTLKAAAKQKTSPAGKTARRKTAAGTAAATAEKPARRTAAQMAAEKLAALEAETGRLQAELAERDESLAAVRSEARSLADTLEQSRADLRAATAELSRLTETQAADRAALDALRKEADAREAARFEELALLTQTLVKRDESLATQAARIQALNASYGDLDKVAERLKQQLAEANKRIGQLNAQLEEQVQARNHVSSNLMEEINRRGAAIGHLMNLAAESKSISDRIGQAIDAILAQADRPWLRGRKQLERKMSLLLGSGLFDTEWYGQAHPDVTASGLDPAAHFILFGRSEGRHPLPELARFLAGLPKAADRES